MFNVEGVCLEPLIILVAFLSGLLFRRLGYPSLPGYLLAGFACHALNIGDVQLIKALADLGILLLLFTIGIKLNLKELVSPQVWGVASLQILIAVPLTVVVIVAAGMLFPVLALKDISSAWILAFALSFSSTVFAVKIFEDRGETISLHANLTIGILVIQDILAVLYLAFTSDTPPGVSALALFLLPLLRPIGLYLLRHAGHGELVLLFGIAFALGIAQIFESLHLKAGLGALIAGVILGQSDRSKELYASLTSIKDLLLIGFFLQIGFYGLPSKEMIIVALVLSLLIFIRPVLYYLLFVAFKLRARTALLAGFALFNYSEFGLIVAAIATEQGRLSVEWLTTLALAVSISFFLAAPLNANVHKIYHRFRKHLYRLERQDRLPREAAAELGDAEIVVLGMGRVGTGAYAYFSETSPGKVICVEESFDKVIQLQNTGLNCVHADATDHDFWAHADLSTRHLILVSLSNHAENLSVVKLAQSFGFANNLAVVSRYPDEQQELEDLGCIVFNLYAEAGYGFAEHVEKHLIEQNVALDQQQKRQPQGMPQMTKE